MEITAKDIEKIYQSLEKKYDAARKRFGRPLTYAEKVLWAHLAHPDTQEFEREKSYLDVIPDRVGMQDATAQMAILQFMLAGRDTVAVPSTVHCDHLILAQKGADVDLENAINTNSEVYQFLKSASMKYDIGFWKPGAGIIHQVIFENYAFPGGLMIGTDSHTPNAGGMGMIAVGVGGADAVDVMAGLPWEIKCPGVIGVNLTGELSGWAAPKDIILKLLGILTVKGGTNKIVEYFGPGVKNISATGKGTITNMGAELGATTSLFPFDKRIAEYLRATGRKDIAELAEKYAANLMADPEVIGDPDKFYDRVIEINLSDLEPHVVGPHSPDVARPISKLKDDVEKNGYPRKITAALIGSCTNSSYEDIGRAANVARQAAAAGLKTKSTFWVSPGSVQIHETIKRDGQMKELSDIGATVLSNACGPCIGQWKRRDIKTGDKNSIITSFNRNFKKRNDGNPETYSFIGSPEIVTAMALAGDMTFNPLTDALAAPDGKEVKLTISDVPELPHDGFSDADKGFVPPPPDRKDIEVRVAPGSERLQILSPFSPYDEKDFEKMTVLLKAKGKCTTDHISQAGPWLRYRGHLDKISDNLFLGAVDAFTGKPGEVLDQLDNVIKPTPKAARHYKDEGINWVVIGDENYGEGSSREHAAMEPRHFGGKAVIVKSFARIHETNLKKQGVLPLTFGNPSDYDKILEWDRITLENLPGIAPGEPVIMTISHKDDSEDKITLNHTLSQEQIEWFKAGSALNLLRKQTE